MAVLTKHSFIQNEAGYCGFNLNQTKYSNETHLIPKITLELFSNAYISQLILANVIGYYAQLYPEWSSILWIWPFRVILSGNTCTHGYNIYSKSNENGPKALTRMVNNIIIHSFIIDREAGEIICLVASVRLSICLFVCWWSPAWTVWPLPLIFCMRVDLDLG